MNTLIKIINIFVISFLILIPVSGQEINSVDDFVRRYKKDLHSIKSESGARAIANKAQRALGLTGKMKYFMEKVYKPNDYDHIIEYIQIQRSSTATRNLFEARYPNSGQVVTMYKKFKVESRYYQFSTILSELSKVSAVYSVASDFEKAMYGNDMDKIKAIYGTYKTMNGFLTAMIGISPVIKMGIEFMEYALFNFMKGTLKEQKAFVYNAYEYYMDKNYSVDKCFEKIKKKEFDQLKYDLEKDFWENAQVNMEDYKAAHRLSDQIPYKKPGTAGLVALQQDFAKRYYRENLGNAIRRRINDQLIQDRLKAQGAAAAEFAKAKKLLEETKFLMAELEKIKILKPEDDAISPVNITSISITPNSAITKPGSEVEFKVWLSLKDGSIVDVTSVAKMTPVNFDNLGNHEITSIYPGFGTAAKANVSVEIEPKLTLEPKELTLDINQKDKKVTFTSKFHDKYAKQKDVTKEVFSQTSYGTNEILFENAGDHPIYISYAHEGVNYFESANIKVDGCDNDRKTVNASGECVCDDKRGWFPAGDECSKYVTIYALPEVYEGRIGEEVLVSIYAYDGNDAEILIHEERVLVETEETKFYEYTSNKHTAVYQVKGCIEPCEDLEEEEKNGDCESDRMEKNKKGECVCKKEYFDDKRGNCLTDKELEDEAISEAGEGDVSCDELDVEVNDDYSAYDAEINDVVDRIIEHSEITINLLDNDLENPCNNSEIANSFLIIKEQTVQLERIESTINAAMFRMRARALHCPELITNMIDKMKPLEDQIDRTIGIFPELTSRLEEDNCELEELEDLAAGSSIDPDRNPIGELASGEVSASSSGGSNPGGGSVFSECIKSHGYSSVQQFFDMQWEVQSDYYQFRDIYFANPGQGNCEAVKQSGLEWIATLNIEIDCYIENGSDVLAQQNVIKAIQETLNDLPC